MGDESKTMVSSVGVNTEHNLYINELLTYLSCYLHNSTITNIKKNIVSFYSYEDIIDAKKLLWDIGKDSLGSYTERRTTDRRSCSEASLNDIIDAMQKLDMSDNLPNFVAKNVQKVPDRQPEELNLMYILSRINFLENKMSNIDNVLLNNDNVNQEIKANINACNVKMNDISYEVNNFKANLFSPDFLNKVFNKDYIYKLFEDYIKNRNLCKCSSVPEIQDSILNCDSNLPDSILVPDIADSVLNFDKSVPDSLQVPESGILNVNNAREDTNNMKAVDDHLNFTHESLPCNHMVQCEDSSGTVHATVPTNFSKNKEMQCDNVNVAEEISDVDMVKRFLNIKYSNTINSSLCYNLNRNDHIEKEYDNYNINKSFSEDELISRYDRVRGSHTDNYFYNKCNLHINSDNSSNDEFLKFLDEFDNDESNTASFSEFCNKRGSMHMPCPPDMDRLGRAYNEVVKSSNNIFSYKNNNIRVKNVSKPSLNNVIDNAEKYLPSKLIDEQGFVVSESRSAYRKRKNAILEDMHNKSLMGPPSKPISLWVYQVSRGDEKILRDYMLAKNIQVYHINKTSHEQAKYKSFKIDISKYDKNKVLNNRSFFPDGVQCRVWRDGRDNTVINSRSFTGKLYRDLA